MGRGIVIGKGRAAPGRKCRVRYTSMNGGYYYYTYISIAEAKKDIEKLNYWQKSRAKIIKL